VRQGDETGNAFVPAETNLVEAGGSHPGDLARAQA